MFASILKIAFLTLGLSLSPALIHTQAEEIQALRSIYLSRNEQIFRLDVVTGQLTSVISLGTHFVGANAAQEKAQQISVRQITFDAAHHDVFHIDSTGGNDRERIIYTRLVRMDLTTNREFVLFEHTNIMQISVSPSGNKVLVFYYEGVAERSDFIPCLLDVASGDCPRLPISAWTTSYPVWLDDQTLVMLTGARKVTLINAASLQITTLNTLNNFGINSFASIPNTRQFILGVNRYDAQPGTPIEFYTLDRDTQELNSFYWGTIFDPRTIDGYTVTYWLFSPDGHYLVYGNLGLYTKVAVVDFETGRAIEEIDAVTGAIWLDNRNLLFIQGLAAPAPLIELDVTSKAEKVLVPDVSGMGIIN